MNTLSFKTSKSEVQTISKIVNRATVLGIVTKNYDRMTCDMDVTACHANGNPLNLEALLAADDFNFSHDVCGIARHIDRDTGELKDCFVPRFSIS